MKIKLLDIYRSIPALNVIRDNDKITTGESVQIHLETLKLRPVIEEILSFREKLTDKLGTLSANGRKEIKQNSKEEVEADLALNEFLKNEVEVDLIKCKISYSANDKLGIPSSVIDALSFFIEFEAKK